MSSQNTVLFYQKTFKIPYYIFLQYVIIVPLFFYLFLWLICRNTKKNNVNKIKFSNQLVLSAETAITIISYKKIEILKKLLKKTIQIEKKNNNNIINIHNYVLCYHDVYLLAFKIYVLRAHNKLLKYL